MVLTEESSSVLDARFLVINGADPLSGFPLDAPDGTVATPSYAFERQTNTGMFLESDNVTFAVSGVAGASVSIEGNVAFAGGAPVHYGDTTPGEGVLFLHEATTNPSGIPSGGTGGILYVTNQSLNYLNSAGDTFTLTSKSVGDVFGPASSTATAAPVFDLATGKLIKNSILLITSTSTVTMPDGAASTTSFSFGTDTNTGVFLDTSLKMAVNSTTPIDVTSTSVDVSVVLQAPDGTSGGPSFSFTTSANSGVFLSGSELRIASGGVVGMTIDSINVALGSVAPVNYGAGTPGVGVVFLPQCTVVPSGIPHDGSGGILYVDGNNLIFLSSLGVPRFLSLCLTELSGTTTTNGVVRFDGSSGRVIQNTSTLTVDAAGQWVGPTGTSGLVTYGFTTDPNTGMYSASVGSVNFVTNGTGRIGFTATGATITLPVYAPDGAADTPSYAFASAPTSGTFRTTNGSLALTVGGIVGATLRNNTTMCGAEAPTYGGGDGVLFIRTATTIPSTNPSGGGIIYVNADTQLYFRDTSGVVTGLTDFVVGSGSATDNAVAILTSVGTIQTSSVSVSNTGAMLAGDGAAASPGFTFTSDTDTGMYISGSDVYLNAGSGVGGVGQLCVSSTAITTRVPMQCVNGLATAPSFTFTGDDNTGVYRVATDRIGITVGGTAAMVATGINGVTNVSLSGSAISGGGEGIVFIGDVAVVPSGTLTSGGILYVSGTSLIFHSDDGATHTVSDIGGTAISSTVPTVTQGLAYWSGTSGDVLSSSNVTCSDTQLFGHLRYDSDALSMSSDLNRVFFQFGTGAGSMYVGASSVQVTGVPVHIDTSMRVGGATGVTESLSGTVYTINNLNASTGTFEWKQNGTTIISTAADHDLQMFTSLELSNATETMTIGNVSATAYAFTSSTTSTTEDDILFTAGASDCLKITPAGEFLTNTVVVPTANYNNSNGNCKVGAGTIAAPSYSFLNSPTSGVLYDTTTDAVGISVGGTLSACMTAAASEINVALCTTSFPTTYGSGDGVVFIGPVSSPPTVNASGVHFFVSNDDLRMSVDVASADANCTLNAVSKRARVTLTLAVAGETSDNLDDETWTDVDSSGVAGTTSGALSVTDIESTIMVEAHAVWASNSTGYRRISITTGVGHTVEATSTMTAVNGDVTAQTVRLIRRLESGEANLQFAMQVYQNSGTSATTLSGDFTMTMVRLN